MYKHIAWSVSHGHCMVSIIRQLHWKVFSYVCHSDYPLIVAHFIVYRMYKSHISGQKHASIRMHEYIVTATVMI